MKKVLIASCILFSMQSFAQAVPTEGTGDTGSADEGAFIQCSGFADVDEYRVGIDLKTNKAAFFDNDTTSYMKLTQVKILESFPPQTQKIFEGKDLGGSGSLRLYFNETRKEASLYSINKKGESSLIGTASCEKAEPWDDEELK